MADPLNPSSAAPLRTRHPLLFGLTMVVTSCIGQALFMATPAFVGLMGKDWGYTESQQGMIMMAEITGSTLGALLVAFVLARGPVRRTLLFALVAMVLGNVAMAQEPALPMALAVRCFAGLGGGLMGSTAIRYLALGPRPAQMLAGLTMSQGVFAFVLMSFVLPALGSAHHGFMMVAGLSAACLPMLAFFRPGESMVSEAVEVRARVHRRGAYLTLMSMFALYGAVGVIWTFNEHLGHAARASDSTIAWLLGTGSLASLVACFFMPPLIARGHNFMASTVSLLACTAAALLLSRPIDATLYVVGTMVFLLGWTAASIGQYAAMPDYDPVGRHIALSNGFMGVGSAFGSGISGYLIEGTSISGACLVGAAFCAAAVLLFGSLRLLRHRPAALPACAVTDATDRPATRC